MRRFIIVQALGCSLAAAISAGDATTKDQDAIQGIWQIVEEIENGDKKPPDKDVMIVFDGNKWVLKVGKQVEKTGKFKLDATKTPKVIVVNVDGEPEYAIYSLKKDTLKLCSFTNRDASKKAPPREFTSTKENGQSLVTLQRQKKSEKR
jgi:uncharacterized protein (TIGR03067 family)